MVQSKILTEYTNLIHYFSDKNDSPNLAKFGIKKENIVTAEQIHGNKVSILKNAKIKFVARCDGIITAKPYILGIRTADCLPIFFYDPKKKIIAAIHAGWQGLSKGIIKNALFGMKRMGSNTLDLIAAIGPHIRICCYNVPEERIRLFSEVEDLGEFRLRSWYLNLSKVALFQLKSLGVKDFNIEISNICTSCDRNYWSFRRDGKKTGRMINIIGINSQHS